MHQKLLRTEIFHWIKFLTVKKMGKIKITQIRSQIKKPKNQKATLIALGLKKMNQSVEHEDSPQVLGMVHKVAHLVRVEEI